MRKKEKREDTLYWILYCLMVIAALSVIFASWHFIIRVNPPLVPVEQEREWLI